MVFEVNCWESVALGIEFLRLLLVLFSPVDLLLFFVDPGKQSLGLGELSVMNCLICGCSSGFIGLIFLLLLFEDMMYTVRGHYCSFTLIDTPDNDECTPFNIR